MVKRGTFRQLLRESQVLFLVPERPILLKHLKIWIQIWKIILSSCRNNCVGCSLARATPTFQQPARTFARNYSDDPELFLDLYLTKFVHFSKTVLPTFAFTFPLHAPSTHLTAYRRPYLVSQRLRHTTDTEMRTVRDPDSRARATRIPRRSNVARGETLPSHLSHFPQEGD